MFLPFWWDSFRFQEGMGSVGLVYPQQKQDVSPTDAESSPRSKVPTFGVLPWRWADVMSDRRRHWKATTKNIFELLPKILNQKVSNKQIPPQESNQTNPFISMSSPQKIKHTTQIHPIHSIPNPPRQLKMVALDAPWPRILLRANVWPCWSSWGNSA